MEIFAKIKIGERIIEMVRPFKHSKARFYLIKGDEQYYETTDIEEAREMVKDGWRHVLESKWKQQRKRSRKRAKGQVKSWYA